MGRLISSQVARDAQAELASSKVQVPSARLRSSQVVRIELEKKALQAHCLSLDFAAAELLRRCHLLDADEQDVLSGLAVDLQRLRCLLSARPTKTRKAP